MTTVEGEQSLIIVADLSWLTVDDEGHSQQEEAIGIGLVWVELQFSWIKGHGDSTGGE